MHLKKLILLAGLAAAIRAQAAADVEIEARTVGGDWKTFSGTGLVRAGTPGSKAALDGLAVRIPGVKVEVLPYVEGKAPSTTWKNAAQPVGTAGKRLEGLSLRVDKGWIRYRGSFVGAGVTDWAQAGDPLGQPGASLYLESVEVEYRDVPADLAKVEFRAAFRGSGFTPWLPVGSVAEGKEGKGIQAGLVALEVRSGYGVRYEIFTRAGTWSSPAPEGQAAGDPAGKDGAKAVRVLGGKARLAVRVKQGGKDWGSWCYEGDSCGDPDSRADITAIQIAREARPK